MVDQQPAADVALPRVLEAALHAFAEQGYHGTSIRGIAARAGLSVPGLYHHYRSKQDVLMDLVVTVMDELLARTGAVAAAAADDPAARFDAVVEELLRFHLERRAHAFVAASEIRSLEPDNRARYIALRDRQQRMLDDAVLDGVRAGAFATPFPHEAARAVATLCVGVATWYREDGPLAADELVSRHLRLARALVSG